MLPPRQVKVITSRLELDGKSRGILSSSILLMFVYWASQVALVVKNSPTNAGDTRDTGLIPGLGRSPREGLGNPL